MAKLQATTGYSRNGLPYVRFGDGSRKLIIFQALDFDHKPPSGMQLKMTLGSYKQFADKFTVYMITRKPGIPEGYTLKDIANDYAVMIENEFGCPVDIMGISTGGTIAQHFAADRTDLVHRLVLAMTGYSLSKEGKDLQRKVLELLRRGKWGAAYSSLITGVYPHGIKKYIFKPLMRIMGIFNAPADPSGAVVELEAEDKHDFKSRLHELKMPTLVIGGEEDFFYPIRDTAKGIAGARLIIYKGFGHNAIFDNNQQFIGDVIAFLTGPDEVAGQT